jgi:drug/metabolite transporter, DME family
VRRENLPLSVGIMMVASGAALWGTDALFRRGLALEIPATTLVLLEHLVLVVLMSPILVRSMRAYRKLSKVDWLAAAVIGAGSSALATVLFTTAFRYGDPTTPLLLQKVQPLVAVGAASLLLGERPRFRFGWFLMAGLAGAYLVTFSNPTEVSIVSLRPALYALGAAGLWGLGTVLGRHLTSQLGFAALTSLRFGLALPALVVFVAVGDQPSGLGELTGQDLVGIVLLALVPGLAALLLYYRGLRSTPASAATLAELAFPLSAVTLNYLFFGTVLSGTQWAGVVLLAGTIVTMTMVSRRGSEDGLGLGMGEPVLSEA